MEAIAHKKQPKEISWRAAEFEHVERDSVWYAAVIGIAVVLLGLAVWQKNFFFGVFVVLAAVLVVASSRRKPRVIDFRIHGEGLSFDTFSYTYDKLESFTIRERPGKLHEIIFRKKTKLNPFLHVPIDAKLAAETQVFLRDKLSEVEYEPAFIDFIVDWMGF